MYRVNSRNHWEINAMENNKNGISYYILSYKWYFALCGNCPGEEKQLFYNSDCKRIILEITACVSSGDN